MIKIQPMTLEHIPQVMEVEEDCFSIPWSRGELEKEVTSNALALYYIATDPMGNVLGYAGMWHVVTEGHITNVAVKADYRRQGIGRMLVEKLIEVAKEKEMMGITLEVRMSNATAQKLYSSLGFRPEGFRKGYYSDTKEDAVIMWKYL